MTERVITQGAPRQLWVGAAAVAALSAAANMASPLYPVHQHAHAMSDLTMTLLHAAFAATALPALLLFGSAADSFGRRPVLAAGLGLALLGTGLFAADPIGVLGLFAGRVLLGIGLGLGTGGGIALMVEASPAHRPSLGSTVATIAFVLGTGLGPAGAGAMAQATGVVGTPYVAMLVVLVLVGALVLGLPAHYPLTRQRWRPTWPSVPHAMRESFGVAAATGFLGWAAAGVVLAALPSVTVTLVPGAGAALTGAVVGSVLLVSAASQTIAPRLRLRAAQTIGLALLALGATLLLSTNLSGLPEGALLAMVACAAVVIGAGHGVGYWGANRETDLLTPATRRAEVSAALYLAFYAGSGLPAVAVGLLSLSVSFTAAFAIVCLALLLAIIAFLPVPGLTITGVRQRDPVVAANATGPGEPQELDT